MSSVIVIVNPVCGSRQGQQFVDEHVLPALKTGRVIPAPVFVTQHEGHAGEIVLEYLKEHKLKSLSVVVASGDGTVHEIVNKVQAVSGVLYEIEFILVPVGTANALFSSLFAFCPNPDTSGPSYRLQSLHAYLAYAVSRPLTIMTTSLGKTSSKSAAAVSSTSDSSARTSIRSAVVTSAALHASILHDSEHLRATHPGIERFKIAAEENIKRWYSARVKLLPLLDAVPSNAASNPNAASNSASNSNSNTSPFLRYSPAKPSFEPIVLTDGNDLTLNGPFSYFLSTTNVDRLEPEFCISPLHSSAPASGPSVDVIVVRPGRDASLSVATTPQGARAAFAAKIGEVLGGAYAAGTHVDYVYDGKGGVVRAEKGDERETVVEYYRCGGWEWTPEHEDEAAHLICADGTILKLEAGETARCSVSHPLQDEPRFSVFGR